MILSLIMMSICFYKASLITQISGIIIGSFDLIFASKEHNGILDNYGILDNSLHDIVYGMLTKSSNFNRSATLT